MGRIKFDVSDWRPRLKLSGSKVHKDIAKWNEGEEMESVETRVPVPLGVTELVAEPGWYPVEYGENGQVLVPPGAEVMYSDGSYGRYEQQGNFEDVVAWRPVQNAWYAIEFLPDNLVVRVVAGMDLNSQWYRRGDLLYAVENGYRVTTIMVQDTIMAEWRLLGTEAPWWERWRHYVG